MKIVSFCVSIILASLPAAATAASDKHAVRLFIKAVKQGQDLAVAYPGAVSQKENASLRRVTKCNALNVMKQKGGYFTVVWDCGSKGALGMKVTLQASRINFVETFAVGMRPDTGTR